MPGWPGNAKAKLLYENRQVFLFQNELIVSGTKSVAFELRRERGAFYPFGWSVELSFTTSDGVTPATPGTFEVDLETSDSDRDNNYCYLQKINAFSNTSTFVARYEVPSSWCKFVRANVITVTNANVYTTLLLTR